ncbi:hypothetical protein DsansV1_C28g0205901 [Dioscorea sansibarensis]
MFGAFLVFSLSLDDEGDRGKKMGKKIKLGLTWPLMWQSWGNMVCMTMWCVHLCI